MNQASNTNGNALRIILALITGLLVPLVLMGAAYGGLNSQVQSVKDALDRKADAATMAQQNQMVLEMLRDVRDDIAALRAGR